MLAGVLREVAEYPNSFKALGPLNERIETGRFTLCMGSVSTHNTVQRQRFDADELAAVHPTVCYRLTRPDRRSLSFCHRQPR